MLGAQLSFELCTAAEAISDLHVAVTGRRVAAEPVVCSPLVFAVTELAIVSIRSLLVAVVHLPDARSFFLANKPCFGAGSAGTVVVAARCLGALLKGFAVADRGRRGDAVRVARGPAGSGVTIAKMWRRSIGLRIRRFKT